MWRPTTLPALKSAFVLLLLVLFATGCSDPVVEPDLSASDNGADALSLADQSPSGAVLGGRPLATTLTGAAEVPGPGDPDGSGTAHVTLNQGQGVVCFEIEVSNITLPAIGAHIHVGAVDEPGPVVVPLTPPDASGESSGCVEGVDADLIKAIRQDPSAYYVNVHTTDFPAGAVRGQLSK